MGYFVDKDCKIGTPGKRIEPLSVIGWIMTVLLLALLAWFVYEKAQNVLNSDMSAEMALSKLLSQEGSILSQNWYYSTEVRILNTQLVLAPLFAVFEDWRVVRTVGCVILHVLLILAYIFMMRATKTPNKWIYFTMPLVLAPLSIVFLEIITVGLFYIPHIILIFVYIGLLLRIDVKWKNVRQIVLIVLFAVLSFLSGLSGVRYILIMQIPLLLTTFFMMWSSEGFGAFKSKPSLKHFLAFVNTREGRFFMLAVISIAVALVGYLVNTRWLTSVYHFASQEATGFEMFYKPDMMGKASLLLKNLMITFGFDFYKVNFFSLRGAFNILALCIPVAAVIALRKCLKRSKGPADQKQDLVLIFSVCTFLFNVAVIFFADTTFAPRYYIPVIIFYIPIFAIYLHREKLKLIRLLTCVFLLAMVGLSVYTMNSYAQSSRKNLEISSDERLGAMQYLLDNDLDFGYATFWNADIFEEFSNGELEVANIAVSEDGVMYPFTWLTPLKYYEAGYKDGEVFVLLTKPEVETLQTTVGINGMNKKYEDDHFVIYTCDNSLIQEKIGIAGAS